MEIHYHKENKTNGGKQKVISILCKLTIKAADKMIPVKQKIKRIQASEDPGVVEAREKLNVAFKQYQENPTEDYRTKLHAAKERGHD